MAEKPATLNVADDGGVLITWTNLAGGDTGKPVRLGLHPYRSVQVVGGGTAALQGSNDGTNFSPLPDATGAALAVVAAAMASPAVPALYIRPSVTGGSGTTVIVAAYR